MVGFNANIEQETLKNTDFRRVLYTAHNCQLVLMALKPNEEIGLEIHNSNDQFFRFESGNGEVIIDDTKYQVTDGSAIIVPAGAKHNVINTSNTEPLKLYTIYSPPHHRDGLVCASKKEAESITEEFDGKTTE